MVLIVLLLKKINEIARVYYINLPILFVFLVFKEMLLFQINVNFLGKVFEKKYCDKRSTGFLYLIDSFVCS